MSGSIPSTSGSCHRTRRSAPDIDWVTAYLSEGDNPVTPAAERIKNNLADTHLVCLRVRTLRQLVDGEIAVLKLFPATLVMAAALAAAPAHATEFLKAIEDVPLAAGLTEQAEPVIFESDQGRVIRTQAEGQIGGARISQFYTTSLPGLGWKRVDDADALAFERENEVLRITVREAASAAPVRVQFELIVKLASTRLPE